MIVEKSRGIDFYQMIANEARTRESMYVGNAGDVRNLIDFLEMNEWFGVGDMLSSAKKMIMSDKTTLFVETIVAGELKQHLYLWLDAYGRSDHEKLDVLAGYGIKVFPNTTSDYIKYIKDSELADDSNAWKLLDYLLAVLPKELRSLKEDEIESLLDKMDKELPLITARLFVCFYEEMLGGSEGNSWIYRFHSRNKRDGNDAYSLKDFSKMAYCIFNAEYWKKTHMVEKACACEADANLWLFLSLHFVCGMRATDITRIPKPELPCDGPRFRDKLLRNEIKDTAVFSRDIQLRMKYKGYHPNKTLSYSHIPEIKLFIPLSLEQAIGVILAIAASYHDDKKPGTPFMRASGNISSIKKFLGDPFVEVLRGRNFASRRANKAYLQGIELVAGMEEADTPKGYILAALARSHKGGIGTLPDMTEIYLKDAAFSGYTPEFIAREMFERGVFGFIPHILLEAYAGDEYQKLGVSKQTELIRCLGISPSGIEGIVRLSERNYQMAKETVRSVTTGREDMLLILQRIATGTAPGKDEGSLCIMTACGYSCVRPESRGCLGCRYEIFTKSVMHQIIKEYARMKERCKGDDGWRYKEMIRRAVLPMVGELLQSVKTLYPDSEMELLTEIMEGGMSDYDSCCKPDSRDKL